MTDQHPDADPVTGAVWPRSPEVFVDTGLCPRCFAVLGRSRCDSCGLELAVPLAAQLLLASGALVAAERQRRDLIARMWAEQVARERPMTAVVPDAVAAPTVPVASSGTHLRSPQTHVLPPPPLMSAGHIPAGQTPSQGVQAPRRSGVQVFLLVAGIVLVSVFALFFVTVAYLFATVEVRVVVTALAGLIGFGVAWALKRRRLPATAEGVGVAGAALLIGVLGFVRGAELFGSAAITPSFFVGAGFLVIAAVLALLHRLTGLGFARIGWGLLAPTGLALAVIGMLLPVDTGLAWWAGLVASGASTLLLRSASASSAERGLLHSVAFSSLAAALVPAAVLLPETPVVSALAYSVGAVVWGAFALRLRREPGGRAWGAFASALFGLSVALSPATAILRTATTEWNLWAPGAASAVIALVLVVLARRSRDPFVRRSLAWAQNAALLVAVIALVPGVGVGLLHVLASLVPRYPLWQASPDRAVELVFEAAAWAAVLAPGIAASLGAVAIRLVRLHRAAHTLVAALAGLALLAAASQAGSLLAILLANAVVAVVCLVILLATRLRTVPAVQAVSAVTLAVSTLAFLTAGHASAQLWLPSVLFAAALIVATRHAVAPRTSARLLVRALLTGLAVGLLLAESALVVPWLSGWRTSGPAAIVSSVTPIDFAALPGGVAALVLCLVPLVLRRSIARVALGGADLRAAAIVALAVVIPCSVVVFATGSTSTVGDITRVGIPLTLVVAAVLWQVRASVMSTVERVVLASAAPLVVAATMSAIADALSPFSGTLGTYLSGPIAAILSAAIAVLLFARTTTGMRTAARIAWECATGLVVVVAIVRAAASADGSTWSVLLLLAVAPLIVAVREGNPFSSSAPRRHVATLSCILAVAALWQFLAFRNVADVEPYTLPVAALLVGISAASAAFGHRATTTAVAGRSILFACAVAIALAPSALLATTGSSVRALVLLAIASLLVAAALAAPRVMRGILVRDSALIAALAVLVVVGLARAWRDVALGVSGFGSIAPVPELWVMPAVLGLIVTSMVWTHRRALPFRVAQLGVPAAVTVASLATLACLILPSDTPASIRLAVASMVLVAVTIVAAVRRLVPLDRVSQYTALSALAVIGIAGLLTNAASPFELATAPLAIALIVSGIVSLRRDATARSWPHLGPGLAALLVPSLLADFGSTDLWRVIALGLVCIAVVVAAIALRWQAPLVAGSVVLIVHAIAQSWPWIQGLYSAVPWWIWLGIGGVVLIAAAARYEHRVRNLRSFVGSIAALR